MSATSESSESVDIPHNLVPALKVLMFAPPYRRQTSMTIYPHGVVAGSALIDMADHLSRTALTSDWAMSLWLQNHYIDPFIRINRLDGIVVKSEEDIILLSWAHQNYCAMNPMPLASLPPQVLWVPGLEPLPGWDESEIEMDVVEPVWDKKGGQEMFNGADMYARIGNRREKCLGIFEDGVGWERVLWDLPEERKSIQIGMQMKDARCMEKNIVGVEEVLDDVFIAQREHDPMEEHRRRFGADQLARGTSLR